MLSLSIHHLLVMDKDILFRQMLQPRPGVFPQNGVSKVCITEVTVTRRGRSFSTNSTLDSDVTDSLLHFGLEQTRRGSRYFQIFAQALLGVSAATMALTWLHVDPGEYLSRPAFCLLGLDERMYADTLRLRLLMDYARVCKSGASSPQWGLWRLLRKLLCLALRAVFVSNALTSCLTVVQASGTAWLHR